MAKEFTINSRKYNGQIQRSWKAELIEETDSLLVFFGKFEKKVKHPHLGIIRPGTQSFEYYWKKGWYNVFRFHEPEGEFRNFYCNINKPPVLKDKVLDYIDLDLDVIVWSDFSYQILDMEEFEENNRKFDYDPSLKEKTLQTLEELLVLIEEKDFPFNIQE